MLAALRIESLAIIDALEVRFEKGLNVLTGETGAGKSILVDALDLLLGGRADPGVVRSGRDEAIVEGLFAGPGLGERAAALGLPADGDEILVRRTVARSGRGRVHVNGALATVGILGTLTRGLVDVSGQHEHVSLLRREKHGELLDAFAGLGPVRERYEVAWDRLAAAVRERERIRQAEAERLQRREFLEFQLRELDELRPEPAEDEKLAEERKLLASTERLRDAASAAEVAIWSGEEAATDRAAAALRRLEEAARLDARLEPLVQLLGCARAELEEVGRGLARYAAGLAGDPARLAAVDERLEALRRIARKHGAGNLALAVERAASMREEIERLAGEEGRGESLAAEIAAAGREVRALALHLSHGRSEAAGRLGESVGEELQRLGLCRAALSVELHAVSEGIELEGERYGRAGSETAEFLFTANVGEAPRSLAQTASGGELSRLLLALKRTLATADPVETLVFDEADTGISGAAALTVGRMLQEVARERQVLCVTHLPQVAAFADVHLHVRKEVLEGRTHSRVDRLDEEEERRRSLARMLAGTDEKPAALAAAAELLEGARGRPARKRRRAA